MIPVFPARPDELRAALAWLLDDRGPLDDTGSGDRPASADRAGLVSLARDTVDLLVTRGDDGHVSGVILAQFLPGALGLIWPPRARTSAEALALVRVACDRLRTCGAKVGQLFGPVADPLARAALCQAGFRLVTRVRFLERDTGPVPTVPARLAFRPCPTPSAEPFAPVFLATHEASGDCPELTESRTPEELLAGCADAGPRAEWYLATAGGEAVGVLVVAEGSSTSTWELAYLGLIPAFRGRGLGRELVRFALSAVARHGARRLAVAVDIRNEPAVRLYGGEGFRETGTCEAWLVELVGRTT